MGLGELITQVLCEAVKKDMIGIQYWTQRTSRLKTSRVRLSLTSRSELAQITGVREAQRDSQAQTSDTPTSAAMMIAVEACAP
jgi:hypothetical protein